MPRRARLAMGGIPWHIIQRGNNQSACFYADEDCLRYLDILFSQAEDFGCGVHAYVLMTNHVHLLLTPDSPEGPGKLMKQLGQRYVQYINRTYSRSGTLWEGRYKSALVESRRYCLACYRYIEMNPVRAGLANSPGEYRWSSFHENAHGRGKREITPQAEYLALGATDMERQRAYRKLFETALNEHTIDTIRASTNSNYALGNNSFRDEIEHHLKRRARPGRIGRPGRG